jgi:hypothetical protein
MEKSIEIFFIINFAVIGASHFFQPDAWVEFFKIIRSYGRVGAFANGFLSLSFGSIIVSFHWVWGGIIPTIITCIGIAQIIKSFIAFVLPDYSLKSMSRPIAQNPNGYKWVGAIFLILSILSAFFI